LLNGKKFWFLNDKEVKVKDVLNLNITEKEYLEFVINL